MTISEIGKFITFSIPTRPVTPELPSPITPPLAPSPPPPSPNSKQIENDMIISTATSPSLTDSWNTVCSNAKEERLDIIDKIIHAINEMKRVQFEMSLALVKAAREYLEKNNHIRKD